MNQKSNLKSLALGKFEVSSISDLIESLTENITPADVEMSFGQIMLKTNGKSLIDIGKSYISAESSPLGRKSTKVLTFFLK